MRELELELDKLCGFQRVILLKELTVEKMSCT
jgi:hypothetical protein